MLLHLFKTQVCQYKNNKLRFKILIAVLQSCFRDVYLFLLGNNRKILIRKVQKIPKTTTGWALGILKVISLSNKALLICISLTGTRDINVRYMQMTFIFPIGFSLL